MKSWKMGVYIISYVYNFMRNRKIKVKIKDYMSKQYALHNRIPHGSPISVMLFLIAYNKLFKILDQFKEIKFCAYADDFLLVKLLLISILTQ